MSPLAMSPLALVRLLQLASPTLPVGAYTYSQGLEWAVEAGTIHDEASAGVWIADLLHYGLARYEAPLLARLMQAWQAHDTTELRRLNADFLASRESAELRAETRQMGFSLLRLVCDLKNHDLHALEAELKSWSEDLGFPVVWAGLASVWQIAPDAALTAYLWAWLENQVMAALKAVPLGQAAGQRLLLSVGATLPALSQAALVLPESAWANVSPGFALACTQHETQYSRLFRS